MNSEITGFDTGTLGATQIVPGAKLSGISYDGGATFVDIEDVKCYVVSVNETSIKLSRDIGSIATTFKSGYFANLNNGVVTQGNQGSNIVYAANATNGLTTDPNEITITGSDLQLRFTMKNPDWSRPDMFCQIQSTAVVNGGTNSNTIIASEWGNNIYADNHPATTNQFQVPSDIVLHFGSQGMVDKFTAQAGVVIDANGKVISKPTDSRYSFGFHHFANYANTGLAWDVTSLTRATYPITHTFKTSLGSHNYDINIYCVI